MKKEIEYYLGYLRNPKDKITSGFDKIKELNVILFKDTEGYHEIITNEKIYVEEGQQVFDGHRVTEANAKLIGRVGEKLDKNDALTLIKNIRKNNMIGYIDKLYMLMNDTRELAKIGEQEYLNEVKKFKNTFRK